MECVGTFEGVGRMAGAVEGVRGWLHHELKKRLRSVLCIDAMDCLRPCEAFHPGSKFDPTQKSP